MEYHGIIVDKSLKNKELIKKLNIIGSRKSSNGWILLKISFPERDLNKMIKIIQENLVSKDWYAHFYRNDELIVIFKDKVFNVTPDKSTWKPVIEHGLSLGIPIEQLDIKPCRFEDETY
jgi:hypothetical protein